MQKIVTNLWFDGRVEEAIEFYTSVFANSRIKAISRYGDVVDEEARHRSAGEGVER